MPELTNEMIAAALGWTAVDGCDSERAWNWFRHWHRPDGFCYGSLPNWTGCIEAAMRDVWPALCEVSPGMSHDWRLRLANTGAWTFYREDDEPGRWYRARSLPELATQICRAYMAYREGIHA